MDNKTQNELLKIGASIPKELKDKITPVKEGQPDQFDIEMRDRMEHAMKKTDDPRAKEMIRQAMETNHSITKQAWESDKKAESEASKYVEAKIKKLIEQKKIPPAKRDDFIKHLDRQRRK